MSNKTNYGSFKCSPGKVITNLAPMYGSQQFDSGGFERSPSINAFWAFGGVCAYPTGFYTCPGGVCNMTTTPKGTTGVIKVTNTYVSPSYWALASQNSVNDNPSPYTCMSDWRNYNDECNAQQNRVTIQTNGGSVKVDKYTTGYNFPTKDFMFPNGLQKAKLNYSQYNSSSTLGNCMDGTDYDTTPGGNNRITYTYKMSLGYTGDAGKSVTYGVNTPPIGCGALINYEGCNYNAGEGEMNSQSSNGAVVGMSVGDNEAIGGITDIKFLCQSPGAKSQLTTAFSPTSIFCANAKGRLSGGGSIYYSGLIHDSPSNKYGNYLKCYTPLINRGIKPQGMINVIGDNSQLGSEYNDGYKYVTPKRSVAKKIVKN